MKCSQATGCPRRASASNRSYNQVAGAPWTFVRGEVLDVTLGGPFVIRIRTRPVRYWRLCARTVQALAAVSRSAVSNDTNPPLGSPYGRGGCLVRNHCQDEAQAERRREDHAADGRFERASRRPRRDIRVQVGYRLQRSFRHNHLREQERIQEIR